MPVESLDDFRYANGRSAMTTTRHDRRNDRSFDRYVDWICSERVRPYFAEHRPPQRVGSMTLLTLIQQQAFSDEATPEFVFQLCRHGGGHIRHYDVGLGKYAANFKPATWLATPANTFLELDGEGNFDLLCVAVPWHHYQTDLARIAGGPVEHFGPVHARFNNDDAFVAMGLEKILQNHRESELYADSMMSMIMVRMLQLAGRIKTPDEKVHPLSLPKLSQSIDRLHAGAETSTLNLDSLAEDVDVSKFHYLRAFKASTGLTPHEYLLRLRVDLARQRLLAGEPIVSAALTSGFFDQAHFTRHFKRILGITPGRYVRESSR